MKKKILLLGFSSALLSPLASANNQFQVFTHFDAEIYTEAQPVQAFVDDFDAPLTSGDSAFTYNIFEVGVGYGNFKVGLQSRFDYVLNFDPDTAKYTHIEKNNLAFVGDVVFSLGCGRIFEGTYEEMFASVDQIRKLPPETKVFCGHEYTESNLAFCMSVDPDNYDLKKRATEIESLRRQNKPTIPTTISMELKTNIFFRLDDLAVRKSLSLNNATDLEVFTKLRKLKDNF